MKIKIGYGYDVHAFEDGDHLIIGGVKIEYIKKFKAHSDGDVLIHAICDALLGAASLRDIGYHFSDSSSLYKNIDSTILLKETVKLISNKGYSISNIDSTIVAQSPKLSGHIENMRSRLAEVIEIDIDDISIKATTTEKLGFEGRSEGISAHAAILLIK